VSVEQAIEEAGFLIKEGGAEAVKLEGGENMEDTIKAICDIDIPVMGHIGLTPQSVHRLGGYKVQGKDEQSAQSILRDAKELEQAGCDIMLLECVPKSLAKQVTESLDIPVIGIGAGVHCDGQVLVLQDMLGITPGKRPRFTHDFLADACGVAKAVEAYVAAVKDGSFPSDEQSFS